jgi:hypothetical protein
MTTASPAAAIDAARQNLVNSGGGELASVVVQQDVLRLDVAMHGRSRAVSAWSGGDGLRRQPSVLRETTASGWIPLQGRPQ